MAAAPPRTVVHTTWSVDRSNRAVTADPRLFAEILTRERVES
jgi:hypothetical protein